MNSKQTAIPQNIFHRKSKDFSLARFEHQLSMTTTNALCSINWIASSLFLIVTVHLGKIIFTVSIVQYAFMEKYGPFLAANAS